MSKRAQILEANSGGTLVLCKAGKTLGSVCEAAHSATDADARAAGTRQSLPGEGAPSLAAQALAIAAGVQTRVYHNI